MAERPTATVLTGALVRLEPLESRHVEGLMAVSRATPEEFALTSTPVSDSERDAYFGTAFADAASGFAYPFAIYHLAEDALIGSTRLTELHWRHRRCELGYTWFPPRLHGSGVNVESKLLLLRFAFETLALHRVQIHTDTRNLRSQRAIEALGARYEGVLRRHMVVKGGYVRDTMVFSLVDCDWPRVESHLQARLARRGLGEALER